MCTHGSFRRQAFHRMEKYEPIWLEDKNKKIAKKLSKIIHPFDYASFLPTAGRFAYTALNFP